MIHRSVYRWLPCTIVTGVSVAIVVISDCASNINETTVTIDIETFGKSGNGLGRTLESLFDLFAPNRATVFTCLFDF